MSPRVPLVLVCLALAGCDGHPAVRRFGGATMGSTYEVQYVADVPLTTVRGIVAEELAAFDRAFSLWRDDSEIARVNAHASTEPLPVSPRFAAVLGLALRIAAATDGAFDPTIKPLTDLYRRAKSEPDGRLDAGAVEAACARIGHSKVRLREGAIEKASPDVQIDLDGLVAGAAADAIAERLLAAGVRNFFLQITGEVLAHGEKAPGVPWQVGIVDPSSDAAGGERPIASLPLRNRALCTSGGYRNGFVRADGFVHHVLDPRTGRNAPHRAVSVSVLTRKAVVADALGTALLVIGPECAERLPRLREFGEVGVLFLVASDGEADGTLQQVTFGWPR